jgi:hypothetical protein
MQAGVTGSIWTMAQLVEEALTAEPCEPPQVEPVAPPEGPAARQTSTGAWLRAVLTPAPTGHGPAQTKTHEAKPPNPPLKAVPKQLCLWEDSPDEPSA